MPEFKTPPEDILSQLIDDCLAAGASAADARIGASEGVSVSVHEGKLESIERDESAGVSLRCLYGQRQAHVSGTDLSTDALKTLAERCIAMAKVAPEDPYAGLADPSELATEIPELDHSSDGERSAKILEAEALEAEAAALDVEGVSKVAGCGNGWGRSSSWVAASNGFTASRTGGYAGLSLTAVAADESGAMERDYDSWSVRRLEDRPPPAEIGKTAGERAVRRIGPRKIETQTAAVIYDRRVSASLIGPFLSAISGTSIARGVSFLKDKLGEQVFSSGINIIDDPLRPRGMGSRGYDGEGRPVQVTNLIDNGRLTTWMLNGPSARQLGLSPNGFASSGFGDPPGISTSNVTLPAGNRSVEEMMMSAGKGLLVTDMFGPSINPNTGDYSVGVAGFWFEGGAIQHPVSEVTIAGDLPGMFARLEPASDLIFKNRINAPSILVEGMSLAGS